MTTTFDDPALLGEALGWATVPPAWVEAWHELAAQPTAPEPWPSAATLAGAVVALELPSDLAEALERTRQACQREPALAQVVAVGRHLLWGRAATASTIGPEPDARWGEAGRLVRALILVAGYGQVRAIHAARGIDAAITRATLDDIALWIHDYRQHHGCWGLDEVGWLLRHVQGGLLRLGRLQFEPTTASQPFSLWLGPDGAILLLAEDGLELRADGHPADTADGLPLGETWTARLTVADDVVCGHPVTAVGVVAREACRLPRDDWRRVVGPGDPVLAVHIAAGEPLDEAACRASFAQAAAWTAWGPVPAPLACTCDTWLLDPELIPLLPAESNIRRFQDCWLLHPVRRAGPGQAIQRVFGPDADAADPGSLPRRSSLQRCLADHLAAGGRLRNGGGLVDLDSYRAGA